MEITPLSIDLEALSIGASKGERAPGLHASTIYNDFHADLDPKRYKHAEDVKPLLLFETGLILETALERGLGDRLIEAQSGESISRPGEFTHRGERDGQAFTVHFNPDLFIFNGCFRVGEIKATYMSSGLSKEEYKQWLAGDSDLGYKVREILVDEKFGKYLDQIKMYGHMLDTVFARLYAWFIVGGYHRPFEPQFLAWDLEFHPDETRSTFETMIGHAQYKGMLIAESSGA